MPGGGSQSVHPKGSLAVTAFHVPAEPLMCHRGAQEVEITFGPAITPLLCLQDFGHHLYLRMYAVSADVATSRYGHPQVIPTAGQLITAQFHPPDPGVLPNS
jgi:hypothetical protein